MTEAMLILGAVAVLTAVLTIRSSKKEIEELDKEEECKRKLKSFNDYCLTKGHIDYNSNSPLPNKLRPIPIPENVKPVRGQRTNMNIYEDSDFFDNGFNQEELDTILGAYVYTENGEKIWRDDVKVIKISASDYPNEPLRFDNGGIYRIEEECVDEYPLDMTQDVLDAILDDEVMEYEGEIPSYIIHEKRGREPFITDEEAPKYMGYFESETTSYEPISFNDDSDDESYSDTTESEDTSWD